ncbi:hypothetical protein FQA47_012147 [Oryzias melastigma]|uniref:Uncharacterized protein n=1 Tax=Oryzias melastigma TaxID=30732 RepID=A0A834FJ66_ORYME|nr:hypothetical protein FQA47_012147 [Oryzias melastigma]
MQRERKRGGEQHVQPECSGGELDLSRLLRPRVTEPKQSMRASTQLSFPLLSSPAHARDIDNPSSRHFERGKKTHAGEERGGSEHRDVLRSSGLRSAWEITALSDDEGQSRKVFLYSPDR